MILAHILNLPVEEMLPLAGGAGTMLWLLAVLKEWKIRREG